MPASAYCIGNKRVPVFTRHYLDQHLPVVFLDNVHASHRRANDQRIKIGAQQQVGAVADDDAWQSLVTRILQ